jgi:hypothetical protein
MYCSAQTSARDAYRGDTPKALRAMRNAPGNVPCLWSGIIKLCKRQNKYTLVHERNALSCISKAHVQIVRMLPSTKTWQPNFKQRKRKTKPCSFRSKISIVEPKPKGPGALFQLGKLTLKLYPSSFFRTKQINHTISRRSRIALDPSDRWCRGASSMAFAHRFCSSSGGGGRREKEERKPTPSATLCCSLSAHSIVHQANHSDPVRNHRLLRG